jgi:hypothetical protein
MVAPLVAAAGIGAVGSVVSGITGGKGAKKAAQTQARTAQQQIAAQQQTLAQLTALNQPAITRGNEAASLYGGILGVGGAGQSQQALNTFRNSIGYQDLMREGLGAVNSNAYARGMGDSGATLKALQDRGSQIANGTTQQYLGNLGLLINAGTQGAGNVAGVTQNVTNNIGAISQNAANAQSNAQLATAAGWQNTFQNLANLGGYALGSSYQPRNNYGIAGRGGIY